MNDEVYAAQLARLHRLARAIDPQLTLTFSKVKTSTLLEAATDKLTALSAENARLRDALAATARALSVCEQHYRLSARRETADVLRAVLRRAWAVLRDTNGKANQ